MGLEFLVGLIFSVAITLTIQKQGPIGGLVAFGIGNGLITLSSYYFFITYLYLVDPISPMVICLLAYIIITFFNFLFTEIERSKVRNAFAQYLSPVMVSKLAESSESLVLGGERKEMTVLFSDIRGFTAISEKYKNDPEGLTDLINQLLSVLSEEILRTEGTIDKYMGDCIMAFWNAPIDQRDHRERAIEAAFNMQNALNDLNNKLGKIDQNELEIGIGINTGECIVGNMGSKQRFDYTVLGDSVNLASRLEGQSSNYGFPMILGQSSIQGLDSLRVIELDLISVKGKQEPEKIYTILPEKFEVMDQFHQDHQNFIEMYRTQNWEGVKTHILFYKEKVPSFNTYYELISNRVEEYIENPPPNDWQGVFVANTK